MVYQVLIVEDDDRMRTLLAKTFKYVGFQVKTAATGGEAQNYLNDNLPQVVILDVNLPDMSGLSLLQKLHQHPNRRQTTAIVITGDYAAQQSTEAKLADQFLMKPVSMRELGTLARRFISNLTNQQE